jgi:hypothetical protein
VQSDPIPSAGADPEAPGPDAADEAPVDPDPDPETDPDADPAADPDDPDTDPEADPDAEAPAEADVPELDELHPATNIAATTSVAPVRDDRRSCALSVIVLSSLRGRGVPTPPALAARFSP